MTTVLKIGVRSQESGASDFHSFVVTFRLRVPKLDASNFTLEDVYRLLKLERRLNSSITWEHVSAIT